MSFFWDLFIVNLIYPQTFPFTYYDNSVKALLRPIAKCCSNDYKIVPSVYHKLPQRSLQMRKLYRITAYVITKCCNCVRYLKKRPNPYYKMCARFCNARYITCSRTWRRWRTYRIVPLRPSGISGFASEFLYFSLGLERLFCRKLVFFLTFQFSKRNYFCTLAHIPFTITPYLHFTISLFRHFARHFAISPFRVLDTPKSRKLKFTR